MEFKKKCVVSFENMEITLDNIKDCCKKVFSLNCQLNDSNGDEIPLRERIFNITCNEEIYYPICDILKSVWLEQLDEIKKLVPVYYKEVICSEEYGVKGVYIDGIGVCCVERDITGYPDVIEIYFEIKQEEVQNDTSEVQEEGE